MGVARRTRQVLGLALGDRTDEALARAWAQVPLEYREKPVYTDRRGAYAHLLAQEQHHPCDKGSGLTSITKHCREPQHEVASAPVGSCTPFVRGPPEAGDRPVRALPPIGGGAQSKERAALPASSEGGRLSNAVKPMAPDRLPDELESRLPLNQFLYAPST